MVVILSSIDIALRWSVGLSSEFHKRMKPTENAEYLENSIREQQELSKP